MSTQPLCLVVDDSRVVRRVAVEILKGLNFRIGEAEHGGKAVDFCKETVPDFVLLDWNMPEVDGLTCLKALRAMNLEPRPRVVMCTTENAMPKIQEALAAGADEYIMKPYDREVLIDKLEQFGLFERA
jgi:two-component system chemotaxis response regulator CheY